MGKDTPRWVDGGALNWSPEQPLAFAPGKTREPAAKHSAATAPTDPLTETKAAPRTSLAPWRLCIGLTQGFFFYALFHTRAAGSLPGGDPFLFDALALAGLFAPLLALEGMGFIPARWLLPWTLGAAAVLAGLGWYQRWRIFGIAQSHAGASLIVLVAVTLFVGQAFLHARARAGKWPMPYAALFDASWILAARMAIWALVAGIGTALLESPATLRAYLGDADLLAMPLLGLASAAAFQITAALPRITTAWKNALVTIATVALPLACGAALFLISASLGHGPAPLSALFVAMLVLVVAINGSYRDGPGTIQRKTWRGSSEFFGAFLLMILAALAIWALGTRVSVFGWTATRLFAAATLFFLATYGLGYSAAALIGLGGGGHMRRLEPINGVLGLLLIVACALLASPLADPMRLAVAAQQARLSDGRVSVAAFDFTDLTHTGTRFGGDALNALAHSPFPDIARAAAVTVDASPVRERPNPTEIGANIEVHTPHAKLPATLLARDWTGVAGVPPCLTRASEACDAYFLDLDGDGQNEVLLVSGDEKRWWGAVLKADAEGRWSPVGRIAAPPCGASLTALRAGQFAMVPALPLWRDLLAAGTRLTVVDAGVATCPGTTAAATEPVSSMPEARGTVPAKPDDKPAVSGY